MGVYGSGVCLENSASLSESTILLGHVFTGYLRSMGTDKAGVSYQVDEEDRQGHNLCFEDHFSHGPIANIVKKCRSITGCRDIYVNRVSSVIAIV